MPRIPLALTTLSLAVLFSPSPSIGQTLPNFSGTWVIDVARSNVEKTTAPTLVIDQTPAMVRIERLVNGQSEVTTYPFKPAAGVARSVGTSGKATEPGAPPVEPGAAPVADGPGGATKVEDVGAEWVNGGLETTTVMKISGKAVTQRTRRTLNAPGTEMTVETMLAVQHGYQGGGADSAAKEVYVRRPQ